ncbi:hypothetical protein CPB85DRAFT_1414455, partial [Mucidula mucida]
MAPRAPRKAAPQLTEALKTKYTASFAHIPDKKSFITLQESRAAIQPKKRKAGEEEAHVDRPSNKFMLYRAWMSEQLSVTLCAELKATYGPLWFDMFSKVVSYHWKRLGTEAEAFWQEMQEETKQRHAKAHPGYKYHPAKPGEGKAAKKRKMKSSKSSASPPARVSPPKTQTPVWDAALEPFQFTFQIESPLVAAPPQYPESSTPSPPVNEQGRVQLPTYSPPPQAFVGASSEQWPTAFSGDVFHGHENYAVAGPSNQDTAEPSYDLDAFNGEAFVKNYNPSPVTAPWNINQSLQDEIITICRHFFQPEIER